MEQSATGTVSSPSFDCRIRGRLPQDRVRSAALGLLGGLAGVGGEALFIAVEGRPTTVTSSTGRLSLLVTFDLDQKGTIAVDTADVERVEARYESHRWRTVFRAYVYLIGVFAVGAALLGALGLLKENRAQPWKQVVPILLLLALGVIVAAVTIRNGWKGTWRVSLALAGGEHIVLEIRPGVEPLARRALAASGLAIP